MSFPNDGDRQRALADWELLWPQISVFWQTEDIFAAGWRDGWRARDRAVHDRLRSLKPPPAIEDILGADDGSP